MSRKVAVERKPPYRALPALESRYKSDRFWRKRLFPISFAALFSEDACVSYVFDISSPLNRLNVQEN